jgi:hypothetical protein
MGSANEPWLRAAVEDAVAPYADLLEPDDLAWLAGCVADLVDHDVDAASAYQGARPRLIDDSGERVLSGVEAVEQAPDTVVDAENEQVG